MKILKTYQGLEPLIQGKKLAPTIVESKNTSKLAIRESTKLKNVKFKDLKDLTKKIDITLKEPINITCHRTGNHNFTSVDLKKHITNYKTDYKNYKDTLNIEIINNQAFITKNPKDLKKRKYKVRTTQGSISPIIANAMLKQANLKQQEILYDPFCKDGTLAIEAKAKQVYIHDSKPTNLYSAKVNATIANKILKENPKKIDQIITILPSPSKRTSKNLVIKLIETIPKASKYTFLIQKPIILKEFLKNKKIIKKTKVLIGDQHQFIITIE